MRSAEVAYFAGEEPIQIVPKIRLEALHFICGDVPELRPAIPAEVPLWLAVFLRKRDKCRIVTPSWLEIDHLEATLQEEKRYQDRFSQLPYHYIEISKELLAYASDDVGADVHRIRSMLADIEDFRRAKVERGLRNIDAATTVVRLSNLGSMELNKIRSVASATMDSFLALDLPTRVVDRGTAGTGASRTSATIWRGLLLGKG